MSDRRKSRPHGGISFGIYGCGRNGNCAYSVVKEMRRQGVARELLGALEKIGKQSGIEKILLDVRSGNEAAHKLYTSEGFTEDGIRKHFYSDPDEDAVLMSKTVK